MHTHTDIQHTHIGLIQYAQAILPTFNSKDFLYVKLNVIQKLMSSFVLSEHLW